MTDPRDRTAEIEALLRAAEAAHGSYERDELGGVYDQDWPAWYAAHVVAHGLGDVLGRSVDASELGRFLASSWDELKAADPGRTVPWAVAMAPRIEAAF